MTEAKARQIIARLEDEHTERKLGSSRFDKEKILQYVAAIANETGGYLTLGVDDKGIARGTFAFRDKVPELKHYIYSCPSLSRRMRVEIDEIEIDGRRILFFQIPSRPRGEAIAYKGAYLMRSGESLVAMDFETLSRISSENMPDYSAQIVAGISLESLDPTAIQKARELWARKTNNNTIMEMSDRELLKGLELVDDMGQVTRAALILLCTPQTAQKFMPSSEIVWEYRRRSTEIQFRAREEYKQAFILYYDQLWQLINSRNEVAHIQEGFIIRDLNAFNEDVIREAVLNAVTHRDYQDQGSVYIRQSGESIVITSPGGFVPGVTPENIIEISSRPRNRRIAEVFQKLGLVERSGQGADKIFQKTIAEGKGLPDYSHSSAYEVVLHIGAQVLDFEFLRYLERVINEGGVSLSVHDYVLLERVRQNIETPSTSTQVQKLIEWGLLERVGHGRATKLILSKRYYVAFGRRGEYTRRRGLDKFTNIELILKHLALHKKGYAKDLEQVLPHLSRPTINRYLKELSVDGKILMVGNPQSTRGKNRSYWELAS